MKTNEQQKEQKTPEQKRELLDRSIQFFRFFVTSGRQGNLSFPCFNGIVGKAKIEVYVSPMDFEELFRMEIKS